MSITNFDSTKIHLFDILRNISDGKLQLPDFQRGWVWDDERLRSLLASVSLAYPIGAVMLLKTGNNKVGFKARPIEGAKIENSNQLEESIVNKTPLSAKTNRAIGGKAPSLYLAAVQKRDGRDDARMDEILQTHLIDPQLLRADKFMDFFEQRRRDILKRIEKATGKSILQETNPSDALEIEHFMDEVEEDN